MAKLWSTNDLIGQDSIEILVWHIRLKHCTLKSLLILSKRGIIPKYQQGYKNTPLYCLHIWQFPQEAIDYQG